MVRWSRTEACVAYADAVRTMEEHVENMAEGHAEEWVWLLSHPSVYTCGTGLGSRALAEPHCDVPVVRTGRGGQMTWHGPGQRVVYVMLDLRKRGLHVRGFIEGLERWLVEALGLLGLAVEARRDRVGLWVVSGQGREDKIAALGVRVRRGVTYHGFAVNRAPDLTHYDAIVPCGIADQRYGVTSLAREGIQVSEAVLDRALRQGFMAAFDQRNGIR